MFQQSLESPNIFALQPMKVSSVIDRSHSELHIFNIFKIIFNIFKLSFHILKLSFHIFKLIFNILKLSFHFNLTEAKSWFKLIPVDETGSVAGKDTMHKR